MTEKRTKVVLEAQAKGFEQAARAGRKLQESVAPPKGADKQLDAIDKSAMRSARSLREMNKLLNNQGGIANLRGLRAEVERLGESFEKLHQKRRGGGGRELSFSRGLAQGFGLGEFFPENTRAGLVKNLAGRAVGGFARRTASAVGGALSTPFTGMQGMVQALSGIPIVGGIAAGQLQTGMTAAQQAIAVQSARADMSQFTGVGVDQAAAQAAMQARAGVRVPGMDFAAARRAGEAAASRRTADFPGGRSHRRSRVNEAIESARQDAEVDEVVRQAEARIAGLKRRGAAGDKAAAAVRTGPFDFIRRTGVQFGQAETAALGSARGFFQASGSDLSSLATSESTRRMLSASMGAQRRFGLGPEVGGAFLRGARSGALGGADPTTAFTRAVQAGVSLGLQGSDLTMWVQQAAEKLQEFDQTGIPLALESLVGLQRGLAGTLGPARAAAVAQGLQSRFQGLSMTGPGSAIEMLAFQEMGGFRGGGADKYFESLRNFESGGDPEGFQRMLRRVQTLPSRGGNNLAVMSMMAQLGVPVLPSAAESLTSGDGPMAAEFRKRLAQGGADALGVSNLDAMGQGVTPGAERKMAALENRTNAAGERLIPTLTSLESTTVRMLENVTKFSKELNSLSGWAEGTSEKVGAVVDKFRKVVDDMEAKIASWPWGK